MTPAPAPDYTAVPKDLTELDQWVVWRYVQRPGATKPTKLLFQATGPRAHKTGSSTDPLTWCSFDDAVKALGTRYAGVGFVFSPDDPYAGIDLDDSLDETGAVKPWAQPILERLGDTYAEISPSGTGIKIWVRARVARGVKREYADGGVEVYSQGRFFTVTGRAFRNAPPQIEEHQMDIDWLLSIIGVGPTQPAKPKADLKTTERVPESKRHNFLMSIAAQFRARGMEHTEILGALRAINQERCDPPKPEPELAKICDWVCQKPAGPSKTKPTPQPQPITTAALPAARADWRDLLILNMQGNVKPILANALTPLRLAPEWRGALAFNEFTLEVHAVKPNPVVSVPRVWSSNDDRLLAEWLQREGITVSDEIAGKAVETVAQENKFHPVRDYLNSLTWDGTPRIDGWLSLYLGAELDAYSKAVGAKWLISAIARVFQPGCKVDSCLILEGEQGLQKSTALKIIGEPWFTDEMPEFGSKDSSLQMQGVWIIELAELDTMNRSDVGRIKAFMSRATDRFRSPYDRRAEDHPRQCVFAGSVNPSGSGYLRDETGARRFWPVACGTIHVSELSRDRDQLWAEAMRRYQDGAKWWLDDRAIAKIAADRVAERYDGDPWDELIADWVKSPTLKRDGQGSPVGEMKSTEDSITVTDIMMHCIGKIPGHWTKQDKNRVGASLRALGWERYTHVNDDESRESRFRPARKR